jgi:hypothetical protein
MGRRRQFKDDAEKQRMYRLRRKIESTDEEKLHYARLEKLHNIIRRAAADGNADAQNMLGRNASDTALKLILQTQPEEGEEIEAHTPLSLFGFDFSYYAFEEAASAAMLEKSQAKDGVFQVVIGTEKRAPRRAQRIAERPKPQGKGRAGNATSSSRTAPKSRKTA